MNYTHFLPPTPVTKNHASATDLPVSVLKYIQKVTLAGSLLGPFTSPPCRPWFQTSPLMTPEKNHSTDRRVILDLSWPPGVSVNSGIPKDIYLGEPYKLKLHTPDDLVTRIRELGRGCCLFTLNLARAYGQLRSDPLDWPLLGFQYNRLYYMDTAIPFGIRWGAMACQRTTNALCCIADRNNIKLISYIDDIVGTSPSKEQAKNTYVYTRS